MNSIKVLQKSVFIPVIAAAFTDFKSNTDSDAKEAKASMEDSSEIGPKDCYNE